MQVCLPRDNGMLAEHHTVQIDAPDDARTWLISALGKHGIVGLLCWCLRSFRARETALPLIILSSLRAPCRRQNTATESQVDQAGWWARALHWKASARVRSTVVDWSHRVV
jgi:hypothetical protein